MEKKSKKGELKVAGKKSRNYFNLQKLHIKAKLNFRKRHQEEKRGKFSSKKTFLVHLINAL